MTQPGTLPVLPSPRLPKTLLLQILAQASGVPCYWATDRQAQKGGRSNAEKAWVTVGVQSYVWTGWDEVIRGYDPARDVITEVVAAHRTFTLALKCFSRDASLEAYDLAERIRFRFSTPTIRALMIPTIALIDMMPVRIYETDLDTFTVLVAQMDIRLKIAFGVDPMDSNEGGYIKSDGDSFDVVPPGIGTLIK